MAIRYQIWLTTLDYVRQHRSMSSTQTDDDERLKDFIEEASGEFISALERTPLPYVETKTLRRSYLTDRNLYRLAYEYRLRLPDDLLSITSVTWIGTVLTASTQYRLADENVQPQDEITIDPDALSTVYPDDFSESVLVAGIWGYVPHYDTGAWKDTGQNILAGDMTSDATETSMTLTDSTSIEVGDYLRLESEVVFVTANASNVVTIERGALGTTAATHATSVDVEQFQQLYDIRAAVREIAVYKYKSKDRVGGRVRVFDGGQVTVEDIEPSVLKTIERHRRLVFRSA